MASSRFFAFLLLISSQMFVGFSQDLSEFLKGTESILDGKLPPCMRQMLTCQPYIKSPENPPPACCTPLKELLDSDLPCLCSFFNNEKMLKTLNVSQSRALELPKNCGAELDISGCSDGELPFLPWFNSLNPISISLKFTPNFQPSRQPAQRKDLLHQLLLLLRRPTLPVWMVNFCWISFSLLKLLVNLDCFLLIKMFVNSIQFNSDSSTGGATRNNPTYGFGHGVAAASSVVALLLSAF